MIKNTHSKLAGLAAFAAILGSFAVTEMAQAQCTVSSDPAYSTLSTTTIRAGVKGTDFVNPATTSVDDAAPGNRSFNTGGLKFHSIGNTSIDYSKRCDWSRWFQTDGNVQGFRLFSGEQNRAGGTNISARLEAFVTPSGFTGLANDNKTYYWEGRYQIVVGQDAALFQLKQASSLDWVVHLRMDANKNVWLLTRQSASPTSTSYTTTESTKINVGGNPFRFRVDYKNGAWTAKITPSSGSSVSSSGTSNWGINPTAKNQFRWGTYNDGYRNGSFGNKSAASNSRVLVAGARYGRF